MTTKQVTVVARFRAKAGMEQQVRDVLVGLIAPTRCEPGCINYDLHQSEDDPCEFMFYENWVSAGDLEKHAAMAYLKSLPGKVDHLLDQPVDLTCWTMIDTSD